MPKPEEIVEDSLLNGLLSGDLRPGDHIAQLALARKLNVSNNPVIQVLRRLEGQGVLTRESDGLCRVRDYSARELYGALAVREAIEGAAARFCAETATDEEMAVIRVRYDKMIQGYRRGDYAPKEELAFHRSIVDFGHAPFLTHLYGTIVIIQQTFTLRAGARSAEELIAFHKPIMDAIGRRDADAAEEAARAHVARARADYYHRVTIGDGRYSVERGS